MGAARYSRAAVFHQTGGWTTIARMLGALCASDPGGRHRKGTALGADCIPAFGTLEAEDYAAIGFRCGLEIHQQLLTRRKLFCRCPAGIYQRDHDAEILRHMRPTLSELGEYDGTALMEFKTRKHILYHLNYESVCTYEMDDAPPFEINEEAIDIALRIALLLRLKLIDELHIARKQYLDGSIPTGFQRTTIVGINGWIPFEGRRIGIRQLGLEEDSCREVSDIGHERIYVTDRLGTPIIETVTEPEMKTPFEAARVGQLIRLLAASTGNVRRGIGSARQDVNVSVTGGTRVEIKGVPRLPMIPRLTHYEAFRQRSLLGIRDELISRGLKPETWSARRADVTATLQTVRFKPIAKAIHKGGRVVAMALPGFAEVLSRVTQPHTPFLQEFSDRVRVIACLQNLPNVISSDLPAQTLAPKHWARLGRTLGAGPKDAVMVVWGPAEDVRTAANEIEIRAVEALRGVPSETRQASADGTNGFERILPGAERMYPDTDLPPQAIGSARVHRIAKDLPERPWDRQARYEALGLHRQVAEVLIRTGRGDWFDEIRHHAPGVSLNEVAYVLTSRLKSAQRGGLDVSVLTCGFLCELFALAVERGWPRELIFDFVDQALTNERCPSRDEMLSVAPASLEGAKLRERVEAILAATEFRRWRGTRSRGARHRLFAMGHAMGGLRGRAGGKAIRACVDGLIGDRTENVEVAS